MTSRRRKKAGLVNFEQSYPAKKEDVELQLTGMDKQLTIWQEKNDKQ